MKKLLYILLFVPCISFAQVDGNSILSSDSCEVLSNEVVNTVSSLQIALESWNPSIDLSQGWNMVGYGCPYGRDVEIAFLDHINDILIIKDNSGNVYIPSWNYNGIGNLRPGYGYQIKVAQDILDFRFCDWYVNNVPNDNINSLQEQLVFLEDSIQTLHMSPTYSIGDFAHGGIVFYVDPTGNHGLVAALEDLYTEAHIQLLIPSGYEWGCLNEEVQGADAKWLGAGNQNTLDLIESNCQTEYNAVSNAASAANEANINGYSDWYLPSLAELSYMFLTIGNGGPNGNIGNFSIISWYWSSSEHNNEYAWNVDFYAGYSDVQKKTYFRNIRPIRSF